MSLLHWSELQKIASKIESRLEAKNIRDAWRVHQLTKPGPRPVVMVFHGRHKSGQSTLLNALLQRPNMLPTAPVPITYVPTIIKDAETEAFHLCNSNGRRCLSNLEELRNAMLNRQGPSVVEISIPLPSKSCILVDFPASSRFNEADELLQISNLPSFDVAVYTMSVLAGCGGHDLENLESLVHELGPQNIFVVFTRSGDYSKQDRDILCNSMLKHFDLDEPLAGIFFTETFPNGESPEELLDDFQAKGLAELQNALICHVENQGEAAVWNSCTRLIERSALQQDRTWRDEYADLQNGHEKTEAARNEIVLEIRRFEIDLRREIEKLSDKLDVIKQRTLNDLSRVMGEIRSTADDMALRVNDPSSPEEMRSLVATINAALEKSVCAITAHVVDQIRTILQTPETFPHPLLPLSLRIEVPDSSSGGNFIDNHSRFLKEVSDMLEPILKPFVTAGKGSILNDFQGIFKSVKSILDDSSPRILELIAGRDADHQRVEFRLALMNKLTEQTSVLESEFARWWKEKVEPSFQDVKASFEKAVSSSTESLRNAVDELEREKSRMADRITALANFMATLDKDLSELRMLIHD